MYYPFIGTYERSKRRVEADISTFSLWEERKITTREAAKRIAESNCFRLLNDEDFTEVANGLGYFRGE